MVDDGVEVAKRAVIEALVREKGEATAERLLYAYRLLAERFRSVGELLEFIREHLLDEVDVEEHEYYPFRGGSEKWYKLRLRDARSDESMKALSRVWMARG